MRNNVLTTDYRMLQCYFYELIFSVIDFIFDP